MKYLLGIISMLVISLAVYFYQHGELQTKKMEIVFLDIQDRPLFGGLGPNTGPIGYATSFYYGTGSTYFEIASGGVEHALEFSQNTAYIQILSLDSLMICNKPWLWSCYETEGDLVRKYIQTR